MRAALLAAVVLALTGCGGGGDGESAAPTGTVASMPGAQVFEDAGCGNCHALDAAGSTGKTGPDLDEVKPSVDEAEEQVREGGDGMPSFGDDLTDRQIRDVAEFVAAATRG